MTIAYRMIDEWRDGWMWWDAMNGDEWDAMDRVRCCGVIVWCTARLKTAQNTMAMLTTFNEIDMHNIMQLRNKYKDVFAEKTGAKLGFMSAFVKASTGTASRFTSVEGYAQRSVPDHDHLRCYVLCCLQWRCVRSLM
jgi:hypothetical protein